MNEFSKTLRFDFPRLPVIGTIIVLLALVNHPESISLLQDKEQRINLTAVAGSVLALGILGLLIAELFSLATTKANSLFAAVLKNFPRLPHRKPTPASKRVGNGFQWFEQTKSIATPVSRRRNSDPSHKPDHRVGLNQMTPNQAHAAIHALEMECREKSPAFGVQLEYYYSIFLFFFCALITSSAFLLESIIHLAYGSNSTRPAVLYFNFFVAVISYFGARSTRRMQEFLRVLLFNHDRSFSLGLIAKWFHCEIPGIEAKNDESRRKVKVPASKGAV